MSKLAEKIRKATRIQAQAIGFGAAPRAMEPTMVLAGLARDALAAAGLADRGADVVILGSPKAPASAADIDAVTSLVAGAWIAGRDDNEATACKEAGFDFVVFDPDRASATALLETDVGYVLSLPPDLSEAEARALETFQLDAIHVGAIEGALTVRRQIGLRRIFAMTHKPLMATVSPGLSVADLQALRDTNIVVVAAEGADAVARLRRTIDALPPRARRKEPAERPSVLVPVSAAPEEEHDHDDDDE